MLRHKEESGTARWFQTRSCHQQFHIGSQKLIDFAQGARWQHGKPIKQNIREANKKSTEDIGQLILILISKFSCYW